MTNPTFHKATVIVLVFYHGQPLRRSGQQKGGFLDKEKNPENVRRGKSNKRRGADAERRLAALIRDFYGYDVQRGYASANMPDLYGLSGIHLECKYCQSLNVRKAMEQSKKDAEKYNDGEPVVIHGKAREEWLVTMPLSLFMDMYSSWKLPFS